MSAPHIPVLLREVLGGFATTNLRIFFDGTVGAGGHAEAILQAHPEIEKYIACDQDPRALSLAEERLLPWKERVEFIQGNFSQIERYLQERGLSEVDGFLCDVGVSSMQLADADRGFSFAKSGPLDMRMNPSSPLTAAKVVNQASEAELGRIFRELGEERRWRTAARALVLYRKKKPIKTTEDLQEALQEEFPRRGRLHPLTLIFQGLRIYVNDELTQLKLGLEGAIRALALEGVIAAISFHSLEDRIVKHTLKEHKELEILTKKPIIPSKEEMKKNPRARSAKLRFAKKGGEE